MAMLLLQIFLQRCWLLQRRERDPLGLHEIMDFKQSDAENLELGTNQAFNSIICRWGLNVSAKSR